MTAEEERQRSAFVTVVAWVFIVLAGLGTLLSARQNIMFAQMFSAPEMQKAMARHGAIQEMPFLARFLFEHFQLYLLSILAILATLLVSAIGLLQRKNWARILFISVLALNIVFVLAGLAVRLAFAPPLQGVPPGHIPADFARMMKMMKLFMVVFSVSITIVLGWVIKKLTTEEIRQEFIDHRRLTTFGE